MQELLRQRSVQAATTVSAADQSQDAAYWQQIAADTDTRTSEQQQVLNDCLAGLQTKLAETETKLLGVQHKYTNLQAEWQLLHDDLLQARAETQEVARQNQALQR